MFESVYKGGILPEGNYNVGGNSLWGEFSGGEFSVGGILRGGELSGGNSPWGELARGESTAFRYFYAPKDKLILARKKNIQTLLNKYNSLVIYILRISLELNATFVR